MIFIKNHAKFSLIINESPWVETQGYRYVAPNGAFCS